MENQYSFENFIINCCKAKEWNLRKYLKNVFRRNGFSIKEDDYKSSRGGKIDAVHNMLMVRGKPKICLVAHTDVCRDHAFGSPNVEPVIKEKFSFGEAKKIIQDKDCKYQVGGDDRLGVAINAWIALNTGYDIGLLFTTDEEIGLISAEYVKFPELNDFDLLVQVDRGNHSNQLVNAIGSVRMCSDETTQTLLNIANNINMPRYTVNGMITDVVAMKTNDVCKEAINMTCGYHNSYGSSAEEYIDIQEARDTMKYVASIVKYYDLNDSMQKKKRHSNNISDEYRGRARNLKTGRGSSRYNDEEYYRERHYFDEDGWPNRSPSHYH